MLAKWAKQLASAFVLFTLFVLMLVSAMLAAADFKYASRDVSTLEAVSGNSATSNAPHMPARVRGGQQRQSYSPPCIPPNRGK